MREGKERARQLSPYCWRFWVKMAWAFFSHLLYSGGTATLQRYGLGGAGATRLIPTLSKNPLNTRREANASVPEGRARLTPNGIISLRLSKV